MEKPSINPENHESIYRYYEQLRPNQLVMNGIHKVTSLAYSTEVLFEDGAEEIIEQQLNEGDRLILASNHVHIADQLAIASVLEREQSLNPIIGKTFVLAKAPYFQNPYLRRWVVQYLCLGSRMGVLD